MINPEDKPDPAERFRRVNEIREGIRGLHKIAEELGVAAKLEVLTRYVEQYPDQGYVGEIFKAFTEELPASWVDDQEKLRIIEDLYQKISEKLSPDQLWRLVKEEGDRSSLEKRSA